jgi:hypothetical protein
LKTTCKYPSAQYSPAPEKYSLLQLPRFRLLVRMFKQCDRCGHSLQ